MEKGVGKRHVIIIILNNKKGKQKQKTISLLLITNLQARHTDRTERPQSSDKAG